MIRKLNIHGDNIVECERAFKLCKKALGIKTSSIAKESTVFCPAYNASTEIDDYFFTFFPGYGRWNKDILSLLHTEKDSLREAPDVLITEIEKEIEKPLLAIEYCGALPAGNQAWQRSGRGYSTGKSKVPYLYIAELGGYELDSNRNRKAARTPNPAIPFSYITYTKEYSTVLPIYEKSPGCDEKSERLYQDVFSEEQLLIIVECILLGKEYTEAEKELENKIIKFIQIKAATSRGTVTLSEEQWKQAYNVICNNKSLITFLCKNNPVNWKKTAYIEGLTETAQKFMDIVSKYAIGITSSKLPMCIIPNSNKGKFVEEVNTLYPSLTDTFKKWLSKKDNLVIAWIMGFKPRGDDARPDRGLVPFTRMLTGKNADILTFVYGPAPAATWKLFEDNPVKLGTTNGLWEAIFSASDAVLVDSATSKKKLNILKAEFQNNNFRPVDTNISVLPTPTKIGENDVDTILHTLLTQTKDIEVFEGMCNPPGGDWSGISVLNKKNKIEYRWLSLPRVSQTEAKRPDHVFQIFGLSDKPILFSVESKEGARELETGIGERLNRYLYDLLKTSVNAERKETSENWNYSDFQFSKDDFLFASAAAYICFRDSDFDLVENKVDCDVIFSYYFDENGKCTIKISTYSELGKKIAEAICNAECPLENLSLVIV
jgi:hypothetical protein